jgi:hypothetical protein
MSAEEREMSAEEREMSAEERTNRDDGTLVPLLEHGESETFRGRWDEIQAGFVDDPRKVVEQADELVDELMERLSAQFSDERKRLEGQWDRDEDVSTEDLRVALTRYRSFFERLLAA